MLAALGAVREKIRPARFSRSARCCSSRTARVVATSEHRRHVGVKADLARKFRDHRAGTTAPEWLRRDRMKREEALYREARSTSSIEKTRRSGRGRTKCGRVRRFPSARGTPRTPSSSAGSAPIPTLRWCAPLRLRLRDVPEGGRLGGRDARAYQRALGEGKDPRTLGRPIVGGKVPWPPAQAAGARALRISHQLTEGRWEASRTNRACADPAERPRRRCAPLARCARG